MFQKCYWYSKIEVSIGRSLKKAKGEEKKEKEREKKKKKLCMAFRGKAKNLVCVKIFPRPIIPPNFINIGW